jgi:hypothetical protein
MIELLTTIRDIASFIDMKLLYVWLAIMAAAAILLLAFRLDNEKARNRVNLRERTKAEAAIAFARSLERGTLARTFLILYQADFANEMELRFPEWKHFLEEELRIAAAMEDL